MKARLTHLKLGLTGLAAALALAACGGGAQGPPSITKTNPATIGKLQFAVGTAEIYGGPANGGYTGLNVVSTYRQSNGRSAVLVDTPSITGPFTFGTATQGCSVTSGQLVDEFSTAYTTAGIGECENTGTPFLAAALQGVPNGSGPSAQELAASTSTSSTIMGTSASLNTSTLICDLATPCSQSGGTVAPNTTTFGQGGGVFAMGLQPANISNSGTPYGSYAPYATPLYSQACTTPSALCVTDPVDGNNYELTTASWGGPPAYEPDGNAMGVRDGLNDLGAVLGVNEGITIFQGLAARAGTYTLNVAVPTGQSTSGTSAYATVSANATLAATAPVIGPVTSPVMTEDGTGGGSFPGFTLPPGATEALLQITDYGPLGNPASTLNCDSSANGTSVGTNLFDVYYTVVVHAGAATPVLPDADGPNLDAGQGASALVPGPTLCTDAQNIAAQTAAGVYAAGDPDPGADVYSIQEIAVDYPLYEASPVFGGQTPTIVGASGQSDISISVPIAYTYGTPGGTPLARIRHLRGGQSLFHHVPQRGASSTHRTSRL